MAEDIVVAAAASETKKIVILGASYAGISAAHYLLKHAVPSLPEKPTYKIVLVSSSSAVMCRPACPRALISDDMFTQDKLFVSIPKLFEQYPTENFRFVHGTATAWDHNGRNVDVGLHGGAGSENLAYHALVIATGQTASSPLHGLRGDWEELKAEWATFRKALPEAKSIVIAGGGPAGIETAGELGEYLNGRPGMFASKLTNPKVSITVVNGGPKILPILRDSIAKKAEDHLTKVGVTVINNTKVVSVTPEGAGITALASKATVTLSDGQTLEADLYIPAIGMRPNTSFVHESLRTQDGRIDTNPKTLRVDKAGERVYAVGDVGSHARPAVHNIFAGIPVVCGNIKRDLLLAAGKEETAVGKEREFKEDTRETQLVPLGKAKTVGAMMGFQFPGWLVWLIKGRDYWLWTTGWLWTGKQWNKES